MIHPAPPQAGHAGATDERLDLRAVIELWRDGGGLLAEAE
jgi:hypothetical protein